MGENLLGELMRAGSGWLLGCQLLSPLLSPGLVAPRSFFGKPGTQLAQDFNCAGFFPALVRPAGEERGSASPGRGWDGHDGLGTTMGQVASAGVT